MARMRSADSFTTPPRNRRARRAALALAAALPASAAASASAGTVLLSRQTYLNASGGAGAVGGGPGGFDLVSGTSNFNPFANDIHNDPAALSPANSDAHQYSYPGVGPGGLQGAYAEGSVKAGLDAPQARAWAQSDFEMTFRVTQSPASYSFGAAMGTAGTGTALVQLTAANAPGGPRRLFAAEIAPGQGVGKTLDRQGTLSPGLYDLKIAAHAGGAAAAGSAYYAINLTLTPAAPAGGGTPAIAVPLPRAAWLALPGLAGLLLASRRRRRATA